LFDSGHGESVVALRMTINSSVFSRSVPSVVSAPMTSLSLAASFSSSNFCAEAAQETRLVEHRGAAVAVEGADLGDTHPEREAGGDDGPGAGAGDVVELVGEPELIATVASQLILDLAQHLDGD